MRVLALVHRYVPEHCAGAETMLHSMLRALAGRGHHVTAVLSAQAGHPYELDGVRVVPMKTQKDIFSHLGDADVLVSHLMNTPRTTFLGNWNQIPVALIHHNTFEPAKRALLTPQARVDLVAVNSQHMADDLAGWLADRVAAAPPTVIVRPLADPVEYAAVDGPHDRVTLVNLRPMETGGGGEMGKGAELFWTLAERMPKTKFLGVKGAYGSQMVRDDLPNAEVLEHVPAAQMRDLVFARTRVLLVPSSYESWGRVATEALHSGIPVIAHPTDGLRENLGDAGIFVDREDSDGWVKALRKLANPNAYKAASKRALARAAELSPDDDMARWCDAVEQVAERGRVPR
ncbi:glycosyltransferase family 4 protein [Micromonospora musae]|uniref:glycosyltransferase family 4 protein n=1 Tax=Micromonospora musae TaxID=1894970 RepID=UPI0033F085C5